MSEKIAAAVAAKQNVINAGTWGGAAMAVTGGFTFNDFLSVLGVVLALGSFAVNWWYKRRMLKIALDEHEQFKKEHGMKGDS